MHEDQFLEAHGSPVGTRLASGHTGLVQRAGTQWWPPGPNGQRHMNTWIPSLADEAVGAILWMPCLKSKNMNQLEKSCQIIDFRIGGAFHLGGADSRFRLCLFCS